MEPDPVRVPIKKESTVRGEGRGPECHAHVKGERSNASQVGILCP